MPPLAPFPALANSLDAADPLAPFRAEFHLPPGPDGQPCAYFCGNSLGLQHLYCPATLAGGPGLM